MEVTVWLSFDLSREEEDRRTLYMWLAERDAKECGGNTAMLKFKCNDLSKIHDELQKSINEFGAISFRSRIYAICPRPDGKPFGGFIFGNCRKANPDWLEYKTVDDTLDE